MQIHRTKTQSQSTKVNIVLQTTQRRKTSAQYLVKMPVNRYDRRNNDKDCVMGIIVLIRLVIIFLVGWLIFRLVRNWLNRSPTIEKPTDEKIDTMVRCAECGVHLPRQNAIKKDGQFFCCEEHKNSHGN